ncbi:MAG: nucleotidyl transferase AbiEii/AbiGii toxin family protein [Adlercreutzia sp.]|nr:nucleotidyl transferase AbiEii/AbiGii toxin family protein [Adlercreutzia sp.]
MDGKAITVGEGVPPWDTVCEIAEAIDPEGWVLVGGLMVQAHAMLAGRLSRASKDVDLLVNVMTPGTRAASVVRRLEELGFMKQEPMLKGSPFHRMLRDDRVVDILVADHLPSRKRESSRVNRWPLMAIPGGAQAIGRRMPIALTYGNKHLRLYVPDLLGALVLKAAAYRADRRDRGRHLDDIALLSSLITDVRSMRESLAGSDAKRLRSAYAVLQDPNEASWLILEPSEREAGHDALRILAN